MPRLGQTVSAAGRVGRGVGRRRPVWGGGGGSEKGESNGESYVM